ncbi:MAG: DUF2207 domain-containing protein [Clostridia bacterium]
MEEEKEAKVKAKGPIQQTSFMLLCTIYIAVSIAVTYVMYKDYGKALKYNFIEPITNNIWLMLLVIACIVCWILALGIIAGKRLMQSIELNSEYEGEISTLPSVHPPAYIAFLNDGFSKDGVDITVTILDLIRRKHIFVEEGFNLTDVINEDVTVALERNIEIEAEAPLRKFEADLIRWIFTEIGDGRKVRTRAIRLELLDNPLYAPRILKWHNNMLLELKEEDFIKERKKSNLSVILIAVIFFALVVTKVSYAVAIIAYTVIQILIIKAIFLDTVTTFLTKKGVDIYSRWMAYKKNIETNVNAERKISVEEKIYSIALKEDIDGYSMFKLRDKFKKTGKYLEY